MNTTKSNKKNILDMKNTFTKRKDFYVLVLLNFFLASLPFLNDFIKYLYTHSHSYLCDAILFITLQSISIALLGIYIGINICQKIIKKFL